MSDLVRKGLLCVAHMLIEELRDPKYWRRVPQRTVWTRNWILKRQQFGASNNFLKEVELEDKATYKNHPRLDSVQFNNLLSLVKFKIQKADTNMRAALPAELKLQIVLRYLATGDCFRTLECLYRVPKSSISKFLPNVLDAIYDALQDYLKVPCTEEEWDKVARGFEENWNFPGCCGATDGKHVNLLQPEHSGSDYYNYKGFFSTVLLSLVDNDYTFIFIDVGSEGRVSDSTIFNSSTLKNKIEDGSLNFPSWAVMLADEGFALKDYMIKPFSRRSKLTYREKIFNYRLSRARRIVENAFGIMAMWFRIYRTVINLAPEKVDKIVKATCALHNWLLKTSPHKYTPPGTTDTEDDFGELRPGSWRLEAPSPYLVNLKAHQGSNNYTEYANRRRTKYMQYFLREGAVSWQKHKVH